MNDEAIRYLTEFHTVDTEVLIPKGNNLIFLAESEELRNLKVHAECINLPAEDVPMGYESDACKKAKEYT